MKIIYIIMLLFIIGVTVYGIVARERPLQAGRITGDFEQAGKLATDSGARLILVVDRHPGY